MAKTKVRRTGSTNIEIADALDDVGDLLDLKGDNPFKIRAYHTAAQHIRGMSQSLSDLVAEQADLTELPGVGEDLAEYITEVVETGRFKRLEDLEKDTPRSLLEIMRLQGVGAKRAKRLWKELKVKDIEGLEKAAEHGKIAKLDGFGKKSEENILQSIQDHRQQTGRFKLADAEKLIEPLVEYLRDTEGVDQLEVAGSYRRRKETVGDVDILVVSGKAGPVMDRFTAFPQVQRVQSKGETKSTVFLSSGLQVDLRILSDKSFGAALVYFTGSKDHNIALRRRAQDRNLKISEYGVFKEKKAKGKKGDGASKPDADTFVCGKTEAEVYEAVDLEWIPPELREDRGEIDAAESQNLPDLVELKDMRGDLQMHSTWSDGKASIKEMVEGCIKRGYQYMALTDHSQALHMTKGLDPKKLKNQLREIDTLMKKEDRIHLLRSLEIDIHDDGSLDLDDESIEQLDLVLVSVHSKFNLSRKQQTQRIIKAIKHPKVNVLAHPTGRLINKRKPMDFDLREVLQCAKDHNVAVECNAQPDRLDLNDEHLIQARDVGVHVVISTDSHSVANLDMMRYGVDQARRAWLTKDDVLNTRTYKQLLKFLKK